MQFSQASGLVLPAGRARRRWQQMGQNIGWQRWRGKSLRVDDEGMLLYWERQKNKEKNKASAAHEEEARSLYLGEHDFGSRLEGERHGGVMV